MTFKEDWKELKIVLKNYNKLSIAKGIINNKIKNKF